LMQNVRRGHYELGIDAGAGCRVAAAFTELAERSEREPYRRLVSRGRVRLNATAPSRAGWAFVIAVDCRSPVAALRRGCTAGRRRLFPRACCEEIESRDRLGVKVSSKESSDLGADFVVLGGAEEAAVRHCLEDV
jgi:hypothetical protein